MSVGANMVQEYCRVCEEPLGQFALETAHAWHDEGCPYRDPEYNAAGWCDCRGYAHVACCPCELEHEEIA